MAKPEEVFIRRASGLTRVIGPWDALAYAFMNPGIMYCFLYLIWTHQLYPGVDMRWTAFPGVGLMFFPALLYIWFSIAMPRSGGEYIWGSRTISPAWGFCACWGLSMVGISWAGTCTGWAIWWGLNMAFRSIAVSELGPLAANHSLWKLADFLDQPGPTIVLGTILIISFFIIMWRGARAAMILSWIGVITATMGHIAFDVGVLTGGGFSAFVERFNALSGTTYEAVLEAAKAGEWPVGVYIPAVTLGAGITYVALNTLGSTYTANIMGEVKEVRKSAIIAMLGALILFMTYWAIFYNIAYIGFSGDFWAAAAYFAPGGAGAGTWEGWPFGSVMPMPNFMLVYLNPNVAYAVISSIGFFLCTYASCMGMAFGPVRNIFAWAFDRVIPTFFAKVDKRGSPWAAVLLGAIIAEGFFILQIFQPMWIAYSILAWFFAWALVGVFGIVFYFVSRGRAIFEKSPDIVKKRIGKVPIITIWGVLCFLVGALLDYYMLVPFFQGLISSLYIWITIGFFILPPFIIYYISKYYHIRKGIPMELQFKEIPPD
ncbi:MAG: APC family permease [Candidatus Bathyarchaeia archaeon]